jgi:hypothetical protein
LPADWAGFVYFGIGLAAITANFLSLYTKRDLSGTILLIDPIPARPEPGPKHAVHTLRRPAFYALAAAIFLLGSSLPAIEGSLKPLYTEARKQSMLDSLLDSSLLLPEKRQAVEAAIEEGGAVIAGRALYPRFFRSGTGEPGTRNPMGPMPYSRFGFYLAGPQQRAFIIPMEKRRGNFPNASDVVVVTDAEGAVVVVGVFESGDKVKNVLFGPSFP